jgi:outer membrane protein assembly factor BamB
MRRYPRRHFLQALGGLTIGAVAGCTAADESESTTAPQSASTEASTAETSTIEQTTTTDEIAAEAWTVDSLDGDVKGLWLPTRPRKPNTTGGPLYATTTDGTIANVAVATGEVRWTSSVVGALALGGFPTVREAGGGLFVVSDTRNQETLRNYVEAIDPETGDREWMFEEREFLAPLGVVDGVLYLAGEYIKAPPQELGPNQDPAGEGRFHALDLATGEERWRTTVPSLVNATVARHGIYANIAPEANSSNYKFVAFGRDGTERWRTDAGRYHLPKPVAVDGGVLASAGTDSVVFFAEDGTERWRISAWEHGPSEIAATPERIYVGSRPLLAVSRDGTERWRLDDYGGVIRPIRDQRREETLYYERGTEIGAIGAGDGTKRWSFTPKHEKYVHEQAVVDAGLLVNTGIGWDREFRLLDESSGGLLGEFGTPEPYFIAMAVADRLFAGGSGAIYAFDVET